MVDYTEEIVLELHLIREELAGLRRVLTVQWLDKEVDLWTRTKPHLDSKKAESYQVMIDRINKKRQELREEILQ